MSDRYWEGHSDGCKDTREKFGTDWHNPSDLLRINELETRLEQVTLDRDAKSKRMWELGHECDSLSSRLHQASLWLNAAGPEVPIESAIALREILEGAVERGTLIGKCEPLKRMELPPEIVNEQYDSHALCPHGVNLQAAPCAQCDPLANLGRM